MSNFNDALELAETILCDSADNINLALLSEMVGESDNVARCVFRMAFAGKDKLGDAQKSLQASLISYLHTDVAAEEIMQSQLNSDWIDSGRGQYPRAA